MSTFDRCKRKGFTKEAKNFGFSLRSGSEYFHEIESTLTWTNLWSNAVANPRREIGVGLRKTNCCEKIWNNMSLCAGLSYSGPTCNR